MYLLSLDEVGDLTVLPLGKVHADSVRQSLDNQMQRWVALTRVIATLLFVYLQVREYVSFHFCARRLTMRLRVASALTPRRTPTEATKVVKCQRFLRQVWRYFFLF